MNEKPLWQIAADEKWPPKSEPKEFDFTVSHYPKAAECDLYTNGDGRWFGRSRTKLGISEIGAGTLDETLLFVVYHALRDCGLDLQGPPTPDEVNRLRANGWLQPEAP